MSDNNENFGSNIAVWEIEQTHPEMVLPLKEKMREVIDPEIGLDVVALGLIRDVKINDDHVDLNMILTTPFCPYGQYLIDQVREKAVEALEREVAIDLGLEPWDFSMMEDGAMPEWGLY